MSAAQNLQVQILFIKSAEDEAVIAFPVPDSMLEFHVQQAIEKLLKALIAAHGEKYVYTHDIQVLLDQLHELGEVIPDFGIALTRFTKFGVLSRYDLGAPLLEDQRQQYRKVVAELKKFVEARVASLP